MGAGTVTVLNNSALLVAEACSATFSAGLEPEDSDPDPDSSSPSPSSGSHDSESVSDSDPEPDSEPEVPVSVGVDEVWVSVSVTGQMVVEIAMISVVTEPTRAGQSVTVAAHEVIVYTVVL